ncbi:hypothetical protein CY34DRAFT_813671 [Suillus luteus UH-Slu-Lm8-n1]|uniref:Uncharacterized protein n=1 Tax=Suillus luteus UH-Slu-Lm8-n1 TaxID=930992 RepID=A0A0D0AGL3_9AGAM|nr:hypothetical protein CY34DRAFT_813671 [Suillus luteus UH-Slu-Lm8-n1]
MSSFAPGHLGDYLPPLGEDSESGHPEHPQDTGQTTVMPDPLDNNFQALEESANHLEQTQDPREIRITGIQQVIITAIHVTHPHT